MFRSLAFSYLIGLLFASPCFAQSDWEIIDVGTTEDIHSMISWPRPWLVGTNGFIAYEESALNWVTTSANTPADLFWMQAVSTSGYWISGASGVFSYTKNSGATWQFKNLPDTTQDYIVNRLVADWIALGSRGSIYTTSTWEGAWVERSSGTAEALRAVAIRGSSILAVGNEGVIIRTDTSTDVWTLVETGTTANLHAILSPQANTWIVLGEGGLILKSADDGVTWNEIDGGTTSTLRGLSVGDGPKQIVAVGDDGTLLESTDGGDTWCRHDTGITSTLYTLGTQWHDRWYAAGEGGLVLFSDEQGAGCTTVAIENDAPRARYELSNVWPNPMKRSSSLTLTVDAPQHIFVEMVDLLGRRAAVIFEDFVPAGTTQRLTVRGEGLASGTYFVRVRGEGFVDTRSLSLFK